MKFKSVFAAVLAAVLCFALTACGGGKENEALYGTYALYAVEEDGTAYKTAGLMEGSLTLEKGGKGSIVLDDPTAVTWSCEGTAITIKSGGDKIDGTIENGIIKLDADGEIMYFAAEGADTSSIGAAGMDDLFNQMFNDAFSTEGTEEAETETAGAETEAAKAADSSRYTITEYSANGLTYDDPEIIAQLGMAETYVELNDDHTGVVCLSGSGFEMNWTDDGQISVSGVPMYTFERESDDCIILSLYDTIFYRLERGAAGSASAVEKSAETEPVTKAEAETEKESETAAETSAAFVPTAGEPSAKGDGKADKTDVLRLMKYWEYCSDVGMKLTYEEMVKIAGVEGEDGGNKGANNMTQYGDHMVKWYAGADNAFVYYTFRRPDDADEWKAVQWMSQNINNAEVDAADISDLLPSADPSSFVPTEEFTLTAFMTDIETKVKAAIPSSGWEAVRDRDTTVIIYNRYDDDRNAPRIVIDVESTEERINFYESSFENLKEIGSRTISGIPMKGRTYREIGVDWTEWYGELESSVWVSIKVGKLDVSEGSMADAIINTIEVK